MKQIIVPTDFSPNAANALEFAIQLAGRMKAGITLVNVFNAPVLDTEMTGNFTSELIDIKQENSEEQMNKLLASAKTGDSATKYPKVPIRSLVIMGFLIDEICNLVGDETEMIVMGTKGATGLKEIFMGSNTAHMIKRARIPVLAIPENIGFQGINKIAYATDLSLGDVGAIERLLGLTEIFDCALQCFHVHNSNLQIEEGILDDYRTRFEGWINDGRLQIELVENLNVIEGIRSYIQENQIDLLAMLTHKKYLFDIFSPRFTRAIALEADIPLLVFHENYLK